jgi:hypothetical protein
MKKIQFLKKKTGGDTCLLEARTNCVCAPTHLLAMKIAAMNSTENFLTETYGSLPKKSHQASFGRGGFRCFFEDYPTGFG